MSVPSPTRAKPKQRTQATPTRRLLTIAPFAVIAIAATVAGALVRRPQGQIADGVRVGTVDLGGKTQENARTALAQIARERKALVFQLRCPPESGIKRTWKLSAEALGLGIDTTATLDEVGKAGQTGVLAQLASWVSGPRPVPVALHPTVDNNKLKAALKPIARKVRRKPQNARLTLLAGGGFGLTHEKTGVALDVEASASAITQAWNAYNAKTQEPPSSTEAPAPPAQPDEKPGEPAPPEAGSARPTPAPQEPLDVTLATKATPAAVTYDALKQVDGLLGDFSSRYTGTANRISNIRLAVSHINGTLLPPGGIFSYNQIVGPRSADAGFKEAHVIIKGKLVDAIGGGICQVSSTLYNAALKSDLKIVTRTHHAFPIGYLPAGRDATVVDGGIDFQFQNNTPAPIYIHGAMYGRRVAFSILGKRTPGKSVSIELADRSSYPHGVETVSDPSLPAGRRVVEDKGHAGCRVTVYRVVRQDGNVVRREVVSRDHYRPFPAIVRVGTRPVAPRVRKAAPVTPQTPTTNPTPNPAPADTQPSGDL